MISNWNEFQGKFGQRSTMSKKEYFTDPAEYFKLVCDESNQILQITMVNDNLLHVTYKKVCFTLFDYCKYKKCKE